MMKYSTYTSDLVRALKSASPASCKTHLMIPSTQTINQKKAKNPEMRFNSQCKFLHCAYTNRSFRFKSFFIIQPLQNFGMGFTSKTFPFSTEMAGNTPLLLEKPLWCYVPSHETLVSSTKVEIFLFCLMYCCVFEWQDLSLLLHQYLWKMILCY